MSETLLFTERRYGGEFLLPEGDGSISREIVTIKQGTVLGAGAPLGQVTVGAVTAAAAAGNTGNGAISGQATAAGGTQVGVYQAVCIAAAANAGTFEVYDPRGIAIGRVVVAGAAFAGGQITFSIADGATDFVVGDRFLITVAEGTDKYTGVAPAANDGSEIAVALLYDQVDATDGDVQAVVIKRQAEYNASIIPWGTLTDLQIAAIKQQLQAHVLIARTGI